MSTHRTLSEALHDLCQSLVDPLEPYADTGLGWTTLGCSSFAADQPLGDEHSLGCIRQQSRALAATNPFAINGHENRISFIVGSGHVYRASTQKGCMHDADLSLAVQAVLDEFIRVNRWQRRQQEIVRRLDRDGEVFLRFFTTPTGTTLVRFVEPGQIAAPVDARAGEAASFGILTDPHDVETPLGYYIDGQLVDAADVQHRKANVDANVKRGLPLYYPVRANLLRAEKLLRNMSVVAEVQSAIALVRKHQHGTRAGVQQFVASGADATVQNPITGASTSYRRLGPGSSTTSRRRTSMRPRT